jgi:hypothetical protein
MKAALQASPPYEELIKEKSVAGESIAQFSERHERGMCAYVQQVLAKWAEPPGTKFEKGDEKYGTSRGFIRMGIAAGAARLGSYYKNLIAIVRDSPDKWTRAGYYTTFQFADKADVQAAFKRDETFFTEHAVYNKALYLDTPAGRFFRAMVSHRLGPEWEHFSDAQMRRSVFDAWARRFWNENPTMYPHPDDDLDALNPPPSKRERDETVSDFMYRRTEELEALNEARLSQIKRWLKETPNEPQRVYPLMFRMIESLHRDVRNMLAETQAARAAPKGLGLFR